MATTLTTTTHSLSAGWQDTTYEVTLRKSDLQPSRYDVSFDGISVGWVLKNRDGEWEGYVSHRIHRQADVRGRCWAGGYTRREALDDLAWQITRNRSNWKEIILEEDEARRRKLEELGI